MIEELLKKIDQGVDVRASLSALRAEIKEEGNYAFLRDIAGNGAAFEALLASEDAKVRKNAAALLGDLEIREAAPALYQAYKKEETRFVRSALLLALEKTDAYPYLEELKEQYDRLCAKEPREEEKKHVREELHVLGRILRKEGKQICHTFTGWKRKYTVLLTAPAAYAGLTAEKLGACRKKLVSLGVLAVTENLSEVIAIRTFRELLFPITLDRKITLEDGPEAFGRELAASKLLPMLKSCHKEAAPFCFRIDMKCGMPLEERSRYTKRAAAAIEEGSGRELINAPDDYEFEIRVLLDKEKKLHIFLKMATIPMERFAYRKECVAASIHPSLAAALLELAKPYFKEAAQILDPCCGVGTMLVERHKILPAREIYGIDIFGEAVEKAKANTAAAGMHVNFIHKDYRDFKHAYLFDEIIANMPQRGKRTKEEQDLFYAHFFDKSEELLAREGILALYSNENGFIKKQLRLHPDFRLYQEYLIQEKERFSFYIIGRKKA